MLGELYELSTFTRGLLVKLLCQWYNYFTSNIHIFPIIINSSGNNNLSLYLLNYWKQIATMSQVH